MNYLANRKGEQHIEQNARNTWHEKFDAVLGVIVGSFIAIIMIGI